MVVGMANKTIAIGVSFGEGSGLNDCCALKSKREVSARKLGDIIELRLSYSDAAVAINGEIMNLSRQTRFPADQKGIYSERKVAPCHLRIHSNVVIAAVVTLRADHNLGR